MTKKGKARVLALDVDLKELTNELKLLGEYNRPIAKQVVEEVPDEIKKVEEVVSKKPELLVNPAGKLSNPDQEMRRIKKQAAELQAERA